MKILKKALRIIVRKVAYSRFLSFDIDTYNWDNCDFETNGEFFFIKRLANEWKTVFDIGANVGNYSKELLAINPNLNIHCFEPNPNLINTIKLLKVGNVEQCAVSNQKGEIDFSLNLLDSTMSSQYRKGSVEKTIKVKTITLDEYCSENKINYIDFIKIDTEGNEYAVLQGAYNLINSQSIGIIQFEYGGCSIEAKTTLESIYKLLCEKYIIFHLYPNGLLPLKFKSDLETYRYSNWIAISKDYRQMTNLGARDGT